MRSSGGIYMKKKSVLLLISLFVIVSLSYSSSCTAKSVQKMPPMGITLNVPAGSGKDRMLQEIKNMRKDGARLYLLSLKWSDYEKTPGRITLEETGKYLNGLKFMGFQIGITIQTLDTTNRTLPPDLMNLPFDNPEMISRFRAFLKELAGQVNSSVKWVMLGNEVDVYLQMHPKELDAYNRFIQAGMKEMHTLCPSVKIGCTCTFDSLKLRREIFSRINQHTEVVTMTYYPLKSDFTVRSMSDVSGDFRQMAQAAGGKPLLLQEIGYPSGALNDSSEGKQAQFVDAVFAACKENASHLAGGDFFLLYDFSDALTNECLRYYHLADPRFRSYLATLGFQRNNGLPKKAWSHYLNGMKEFAK
jgi:hypothetical protein